ncbi:hypothetical protein H310_02430 [Aphanomyces invadans]|uniref:Uncharacterized protein n=1 Tax=Aphanomyces invadans TaxID=157072 RepID=A0A024UP33_9STRA|nr:hypothetical protein H310_02430 [Aphanomyces invadans]ETW08064.1 hypothetical protein H310_02430 [Aphanomyces invadans]|eukprot:XP_008864157.1 hypothetical protein H310_02430 [Aphanomyces invadans]
MLDRLARLEGDHIRRQDIARAKIVLATVVAPDAWTVHVDLGGELGNRAAGAAARNDKVSGKVARKVHFRTAVESQVRHQQRPRSPAVDREVMYLHKVQRNGLKIHEGRPVGLFNFADREYCSCHGYMENDAEPQHDIICAESTKPRCDLGQRRAWTQQRHQPRYKDD